MRAVFGLTARQLLSERTGCSWAGWLWLSARAAHFWWGWSAIGWPVGCLVGELAVGKHALCLFGSCGWAAGVHVLSARLGPPIVEACRDLDLGIIPKPRPKRPVY